MSETVRGVKEFEAAIASMKARVVAATSRAVMEGAARIQAEAQKRSSGRPGPRVVSGAHWRSIHTEGPRQDGTRLRADIGPSMIYSRRLELGYTGEDALGRLYHQPELPYMRPALDAVTAQLGHLFEVAWGNATSGT